MKQFKDLGIKPVEAGFVGDKIKMNKILNREIIVHKHKVDNSKYEKGNGKCLCLQIEFNNEKHIVFTGSTSLMQQIEQIEESQFPFKTIIVEENERFQFT